MTSPFARQGSIRIAGTAALVIGLASLAIAPAQSAYAQHGGSAAASRVTPRVLPSSTALALIRTIELGNSGLAAAVGGQSTVSAADDTIYVTSNDQKLSIIDPVSLTKVGAVTVGNYPIGVTVHPDDTVYVVNANTNDMTVINGRTATVAQTISVPQEPQVVAVSRVSDDTLFITSRGGSPQITNLSARTLSGQVSTAIGLSAPTPFGLGLTHDDSAYIATWPNQPRLVNSVTGAVTNLVSLGTGFHGVTVSADDTVYMTNESSNTVKSFAASAPGTVASVSVASTPQSVAIGNDGSVYVASKNAATVSAINPVTNQVDDSVAVGSGPYGIAVTRTGLVITANNYESTASIVAAVSPALTTTSAFAGDTGSLTIGGLPTGVLVDDTTVRSISFGDDTVPWTRTPGTNTFTGAIPSGSGTLDVIVALNGGNRVYAGSFTYTIPPPPPPAPTLADPPRDVVAIAGDASAMVSWATPASTGSFPVSDYLVTSSPGGRSCLTSSTSCDVSGLTNGTAYTFTVQALTGAGWSANSRPSNAVVPRASAKPTLVITGAREGRSITVTGQATGLDAGTLLTPHVARSLGDFRPGVRFATGTDGSVTWSRRASATVVWRVYVAAGDVRSNTVTIR